MNKSVGIVLFIIGTILFIIFLVFLFPIPDYMRIPLILVALAIVAIEAVKDWKTFIDKVFKFSATFIILSLMFIIIFIYLGLTNTVKPFIILTVATIVLAIGAYVTRD